MCFVNSRLGQFDEKTKTLKTLRKVETVNNF